MRTSASDCWTVAIYEYTPFCNGPGDVKSPRVMVASPSSRLGPMCRLQRRQFCGSLSWRRGLLGWRWLAGRGRKRRLSSNFTACAEHECRANEYQQHADHRHSVQPSHRVTSPCRRRRPRKRNQPGQKKCAYSPAFGPSHVISRHAGEQSRRPIVVASTP